MLRRLQNYPHALERFYQMLILLLRPFARWLQPNGRAAAILTRLEKTSKEAVFNCKMCGQCILHATGMTCSLECPKNLRNGPCGGVRHNGHCEVKPEMRCVWVEAFERSRQMPLYGHEMLHIQPPMNRQLQGTSSWVNMLHGIDSQLPAGWVKVENIECTPSAQKQRTP